MALRKRSELERVVKQQADRVFGFPVRVVPVQTRPLLVIDGAHFDALLGKIKADDLEQVRQDVTGGIVWVEPYAATLQPSVDAGVAKLKQLGAARVVVLPPADANRELPQAVVEQATRAFVSAPAMVREVAAELLMGANAPEHVRTRAVELVDEYLTGAGL